MRSTSLKKRMEFVNRDLNIAMNIRRWLVPKPSPAELTRSNCVAHAVVPVVCKQKLKPIAVGRSKKTEKRLQVGIKLPYSCETLLFH